MAITTFTGWKSSSIRMPRPSVGPHLLTPEILVRAYAAGVFPMSESRDDPTIFWVDPEVRGILPLDGLHVSRSLRKTVRKSLFEVRCDTAFEAVIDACAETTPERPETWINDKIRRCFIEMHTLGLAHSVETWKDGRLVGGLYGLALKGAFFGESMFSRMTDASKVALVHLVARLNISGFRLLDSQFLTEHLHRLGAIEISAADYHKRLDDAFSVDAEFYCDPPPSLLEGALEAVFMQSRTQTS
ncbi:leucyl/phenylalanyl-tRNA--protein transferase [Varunaivibrio sulfuroxidans]|uniref:Leucyl/phenylalanyl-tRNA--protein transferase n=2 Tax=Varunaivibrio sulfuroxidans TaxID=1773489 RepID=A0A4R3J5Y2_9PROT|nr:leucyl/phenylalanyl-tRNA--protein transferase [Varunaivibrio sulfuroxidans]